MKENVKPITSSEESAKDQEPSKTITGGQPTSFTLAMRQAGQEAAQKAKEVKKKATETFVGLGKAEPEAEKDESKSRTSPLSITPKTAYHTIDTATLAQSPTSTAWSWEIHGKAAGTSVQSIEKLESLQSPTSTLGDLPAPTNRRSSISEASAECIKQIEEDETIPEEDEPEEDENGEED